jgi:alpha-L-fucosidase 2
MIRPSQRRCVAASLVLWSGLVGAAAGVPPREYNLVLEAPITTWDEAVPLGNGLMGGLLWGEGSTLRLSLDRGDLWDERPAVEPLWWKSRTYARAAERIAAQDYATVNQWWDSPYNGVTPTKLPAGRLEVTLAPGQGVERFELDLAAAEGLARLANHQQVSVLFSAAAPVALVRIPGPAPAAVQLLPAGAKPREGTPDSNSLGAVSQLGYPPAEQGRLANAQWFVQEAAEQLRYCVCVDARHGDEETVLAIAITSTRDSQDPLGLARQRCADALARGYTAMRAAHGKWWETFWSQSSVSFPPAELPIARQYYLVRSFYGAASRRGAPPMPLQGVWTADDGGLPPWKGDYHNDLNTQMTYIAYQAAGHFDEGLAYLDYLWDRREVFTAFARDFYDAPGLACPGVMSLAGQPLGGWGQYSLSPTMSAWSAHLFYLHWRYTVDDTFLRTRAYPWCADVGRCMLSLLTTGTDGRLILPLSSSPEIFDNSPQAWLVPNSNYDLMCLKMLFLSLQEMAEACGKPEEAQAWAASAAQLGDYHTDANGVLLLDATAALTQSHRHLSNLIGLHPFNLINCERGPLDGQRIAASLAQWDQLGTSAWCGYSFSWMSCLQARVGNAEAALRNLDIFCRAFVLRNGFHANGDQTRSGYSNFTYRPFTLEGNFLAVQAVHEMLLQSWSPTPGAVDSEIVRIFPATPARWADVAFADLRTEGGHRVSARREQGVTTWLRIVAGRSGVIRIRNNFGGRPATWDRPDVGLQGDCYEVSLQQGESLTATLPSVQP